MTLDCEDYVIDICKCGHSQKLHYDWFDALFLKSKNKSCRMCKCMKNDFDYSTTASEHYNSQENKK